MWNKKSPFSIQIFLCVTGLNSPSPSWPWRGEQGINCIQWHFESPWVNHIGTVDVYTIIDKVNYPSFLYIFILFVSLLMTSIQHMNDTPPQRHNQLQNIRLKQKQANWKWNRILNALICKCILRYFKMIHGIIFNKTRLVGDIMTRIEKEVG